jgi:integrase
LALTDVKIKALRARTVRYLVADGNGLNIEVLPSGKLSWIFRYRLRGKPEKVALGRYPELTLKRAREERDIRAALVAGGKSPAQTKRLERQKLSAEMTLRDFGQRYFDEVVTKNRKDPRAVERYLIKDIYPSLGRKPLKDVTPVEIQSVVFNKRDQGREAAAGKLRETLKGLFDYAVGCQLILINPVSSLPLRFVTKARPRTRALSPNEIKIYLQTLYRSNIRRQFKLALHLILVTLVRKSELLLARWEHIDLESGEWEIPVENTKNGKPHVVYLSSQASGLLKELKTLASGSDLVLPGRSNLSKPFAADALNKALEGVNFDIPPFTIHDMRRTASTVLHEKNFPSDVIEKALNHTIGGVRGVYNKAEYASQRKKMLQWWGDYIEQIASESKVVIGNFMRA